MQQATYNAQEMQEIVAMARQFRHNNLLRLPCLFHGNHVANRNPESKIVNWSTITMCSELSTGKWVYLIYAYPLSVVHRIMDGMMKGCTEKYCAKIISSRRWKDAFVSDSFIPVIPIPFDDVVALPYIDNVNFADILMGRVGGYDFFAKMAMLRTAAEQIAAMHAKGIVWGELIVQNMLRSEPDGEIVICDTETKYYRGTLAQQKASDWLDFICSAVGCLEKSEEKMPPFSVVYELVQFIKDDQVKRELKAMCAKPRDIIHIVTAGYTTVRLSCPPTLYKEVKREINRYL